ncbi:alcohol dehydrogenase catalytic domain-containing protein [Pseudonocardia spinosispora]|uniref:alcohol dehydrogenase catalytic domain-containing protein n=1 Tax=Pseudonocardia spinosispora TaxID=103441 RepID=UPI00048DE7D6|nr:alcohol dehydrogenase catalytic domain-containing protein [Pseudonocardia spinosispora]
MRTVVIDSRGDFRLERRPSPVAGPGSVVVAVRAAGLNAADLQQARGDYPAPAGWPADVPGLEVAGEVEQVGAGVTGFVPGDRVMALVGGGGHAERIAVPADLLLPVPDGLPWEQAAGFPEAFSTAWDALVLRMFDLMLARARLIGTTIRGRAHAEKALLAATVRTSVVPLLAQGRLRVPVDSAFTLDRFADAYARLAGPGKFGKVVMTPWPSAPGP